MSVQAISTIGLYQALKNEGYELPRECRDVRLIMPTAGAFLLQFDCNVTGEDLEKIGRALAKMGVQFK